MAELWDALEENSEEQNNEVVPLRNIIEISPTEMVVYDMNNENLVREQTDSLRNSMAFCEQIVIAAYQVVEYVPDLRNNEHSEFWKDKVIPNLVDSLKQDVRARATLSRALSSIRDLAITIQKAAEIVKQSKGSKKAIEISQRNIPAALKTLDNCIELVDSIENTAIQKFGEQTSVLAKIIGPEAVKYVDQKAEIEAELNGLYKKQQKLITELGEKQGEVSRLNHMINATEKQVLGVNEALEETQRRTKELAQLNSDVENAIKSIPVTTPKTVTTKKGWWLLRELNSFTTSHTEMVRNPHLEADKNYNESIVLSRMHRIRENKTDEDSKQKVMNDLNNSLSDLKAKYEKASAELDELQKALPDQMKMYQDQIDNYIKNMEEIEKSKVDISNMVGHHGNTLIQCLIQVQTFTKSIKGGASAYAPLVSILSGIKAMVQSDVELLSSDESADIFLAGNRLLKQVQFLSNYTATATKALQPSTQFNSLTNMIEFKQKASITNY